MKNRILKITALLLAINFLTSTLAPTLMYALTAGPTAPEYTSFEPIDTTDMVNLATGDFTYNIPLLEVPGPEGGYPLALSYHAGISPEEESSWTGLGWNLNAGSINRTVNGYADDVNGSSELVHDTWSGGETNTFSIGIGVGIANVASVGVGVVIAEDTYKGTGIGVNANAGIRLGNGGLTVGLQAGADPYGGGYVGLGLSAGTPGSGVGASVSVGVRLSFDNSGTELSANGGAGINYKGSLGRSNSIMNANISTSSTKPSFGYGGISISAANSKSNNLAQDRGSFSLDIPLYYGINLSLGSSNTRYYLDQIDATTIYGSLYGANIPSNINNISFDCFAFKPVGANYFTDSDIEMGGSMPAYDDYTVLGQGVGGSIQPYIFEQGSLFRKLGLDQSNLPSKAVYFDYAYNQFQNSGVGFRFVNDFSNSFTRQLSPTYSSATNIESQVDLTADIGIEHKNYTQTNFLDFNKSNGMLAGSKHVEWFSNRQIRDAFTRLPEQTETEFTTQMSDLHGFIPDIAGRPNYFQVSNIYGQDAPDNIGGFLVINQSGVSYHYSIPVYNFEDVSEHTSNTQGVYSRKISKTTPYAYSWLLTAMTGPDYVDRVPLGVVDENDWGYWVKFEYGKWTDKYIWRNPSTGTEKDIDSDVGSYAAGKKELYYLDAIKTRSHTALFVKGIRKDGKGVGEQSAGGFQVQRDASNNITGFPASTLKLERILLYTNSVLAKELENRFDGSNGGPISTIAELKTLGTSLKHSYSVNSNTIVAHNGGGILDESDLSRSSGDMTLTALRQIHFDYTYDLCPGTINSFDMDYTSFTPSTTTSGKLTLESIRICGVGDKRIIPPTSFKYALSESPYDKDAKDIWGLYKSDYNTTPDQTERKKTQQVTTDASEQSVHAWSLNGINTGIGASINIDYESDIIKNSVLSTYGNLGINSVELIDATNNRLKIKLFTSEDLSKIDDLVPNMNLNMACFVPYSSYTEALPNGAATVAITQTSEIPSNYYDLTVKLISKSDKEIIIESSALTNLLNPFYTQNVHNGQLKYKLNVSAGNIIFPKTIGNQHPGGGLRVKQIYVTSDNTTNYTTYTYFNGTTSYDPIDMAMYPDRNGLGIDAGMRNLYKDKLYSYYTDIISSASFLPPPGVIYEKVVVQDKVRHYNGSSYTEIAGVGSEAYEFSVFNSTLLPRQEVNPVEVLSADQVQMQRVKIKDLRLQVGLLKRITHYSGQNETGNPISITENKYLHDNFTTNNDYATDLNQHYNNQGRIDQLYFERKGVGNDPGTRVQKLVVTEIEEFPVIPLGQKLDDKKKDLVQESSSLEFDFYTGTPLVVYNKDAYNNEFLSKTIPAYQVYPDMSFKVNIPANKHMLSQMAASYGYKVSPAIASPRKFSDYTRLGLISASAKTWGTGITVMGYSNNGSIGVFTQPSIWREQTSYLWIGNDNIALNIDGTYPVSGFSDFNFTSLSSNPSYWQKTGELTLCDIYSHPLENRDINNLYGSALRDPSYQYVLASASNARFDEIAYSGCEHNFNTIKGINNFIYEGRVNIGQGTYVNDKDRAHTGNYSLLLGRNQEGFVYSFFPDATKQYRASVWVYLPGSAEGNGTNSDFSNAQMICRTKAGQTVIGTPAIRSITRKANSSYLIELIINTANVPIGTNGLPVEIEVVCKNNDADRSLYFDDFRVHPLTSAFTSYVYNIDRSQLIYILDANNLYTRFEYDDAGKLLRTFKELFNKPEMKINEQRYNYGKNQ